MRQAIGANDVNEDRMMLAKLLSEMNLLDGAIAYFRARLGEQECAEDAKEGKNEQPSPRRAVAAPTKETRDE